MDTAWVEQKEQMHRDNAYSIINNILEAINEADWLSEEEKKEIVAETRKMMEYRPYLASMFRYVIVGCIHDMKTEDDLKKYFKLSNLCADMNIENAYFEMCRMDHVRRLLDSEPVHFDGDIVITDPCYIVRDGDWETCNYGADMASVGLPHSIVRDTLYGDWSCTVFSENDRSIIGNFCADAGLVGVFDLNEILKYNPRYRDHIDKTYAAACIKNFCGTVRFVVANEGSSSDEDNDDDYDGYYVRVVGCGVNKLTGEPVSFYSAQTGW